MDNLFVFMLLLSAFAVPAELQQRVLLYGIVGALVLRGIFIALGAAVLANQSWAFLLFGAILLVTAVKILRDQASGHGNDVDVSSMRSVKLLRRFMPVTDTYQGPRMFVQQGGRRAATPFALVVSAVLVTDVVFAVDSVPAVYGITGDPYLLFATNAFALLGLRALYFVLEGALSRLVHLGYGLAAILAFIGTKLVLHWAHGVWPGVPEIPTLLSLGVIVVVLALVTATSLYATRGDQRGEEHPEHQTGHVSHPGGVPRSRADAGTDTPPRQDRR
ncbi:TerC/Alx family metal homeostasis membrane protein [Blastococcus saxobsidens]|uniref:TerC family integral membrane protein n=1 Tax=Blastococcus saxobsidens TaxID=138336 RepID=A0A4Q7Y6M6_9ACTN|nr:TerC/Alx family metal homeostasis membrane protein [Blastococcus saxobsidens]RZU32328.1 TerC family integral membrane protein [Blastococcus saxobsidens]